MSMTAPPSPCGPPDPSGSGPDPTGLGPDPPGPGPDPAGREPGRLLRRSRTSIRSLMRPSRPRWVGVMSSLSVDGAAPPRRVRQLSSIDPACVSQSGLAAFSELETSRGSVRIQHLTAQGPGGGSGGNMRFALIQCAHFHYENVELPSIDVQLDEEDSSATSETSDSGGDFSGCFSLSVTCRGRSWTISRSLENLRLLDSQLHTCIFDRRYSQLLEPPSEGSDLSEDGQQEAVEALVADYLHRFSQIAGPLINCAPILNWFELDNRGNRLLVADDSDINTPAVAAALVDKRYVAQASDEISLEVGDMISVIDMAPPDESIWWRGKRGFEVGFFPCECVQLIGDQAPQQLALTGRHRRAATLQPGRPVLRRQGKLTAFFRSFIQTRPSRRRLKQSGILRERVFGCDLGEHLLNSGQDIPVVLRCCAEFIEAHGIVDGIYRLSGITSNIQRLRNAFDEDRVPDLSEPSVRQDIHSVSCLLKQYLRELPNPLLTYQLYDKFVAAVQNSEDQRLLRMRDVVRQLPPPHYRTLEYLVHHLSRVATRAHSTGMTAKNLAIVWAPNLVRSRELESGGVAALQGVGVQAVLVEYLIRYCELVFSDKLPAFCPDATPARSAKRSRPKSLAISTPAKLLSLEEARARALGSPAKADNYIEVGGGPSALPTKYHTVLRPPQRKCGSLKFGRSPIGWRSLFRGRSSKAQVDAESEPVDISRTNRTLTESDLSQSRAASHGLRSVRSAESLVPSTRTESQLISQMLNSQGVASTARTSRLAPRAVSEPDSPDSDSASPSPVRSVSNDSYFCVEQRTKPTSAGGVLREEAEDGDESCRQATPSPPGVGSAGAADDRQPLRLDSRPEPEPGAADAGAPDAAHLPAHLRGDCSCEPPSGSAATSAGVSSLRTDSVAPLAPPGGRQVAAAAQDGAPGGTPDSRRCTPAEEDATGRDLSEMADEEATAAGRSGGLVPEALQLLELRLSAAGSAAGVGEEYENVAPQPYQNVGVDTPDTTYEPVEFSGGSCGSRSGGTDTYENERFDNQAYENETFDNQTYENETFANVAELPYENVGSDQGPDGAAAAPDECWLYEDVAPALPAADAGDQVYEQVREFRRTLQEVNSIVQRSADSTEDDGPRPSEPAVAAPLHEESAASSSSLANGAILRLSADGAQSEDRRPTEMGDLSWRIGDQETGDPRIGDQSIPASPQEPLPCSKLGVPVPSEWAVHKDKMWNERAEEERSESRHPAPDVPAAELDQRTSPRMNVDTQPPSNPFLADNSKSSCPLPTSSPVAIFECLTEVRSELSEASPFHTLPSVTPEPTSAAENSADELQSRGAPDVSASTNPFTEETTPNSNAVEDAVTSATPHTGALSRPENRPAEQASAPDAAVNATAVTDSDESSAGEPAARSPSPDGASTGRRWCRPPSGRPRTAPVSVTPSAAAELPAPDVQAAPSAHTWPRRPSAERGQQPSDKHWSERVGGRPSSAPARPEPCPDRAARQPELAAAEQSGGRRRPAERRASVRQLLSHFEARSSEALVLAEACQLSERLAERAVGSVHGHSPPRGPRALATRSLPRPATRHRAASPGRKSSLPGAERRRASPRPVRRHLSFQSVAGAVGARQAPWLRSNPFLCDRAEADAASVFDAAAGERRGEAPPQEGGPEPTERPHTSRSDATDAAVAAAQVPAEQTPAGSDADAGTRAKPPAEWGASEPGQVPSGGRLSHSQPVEPTPAGEIPSEPSPVEPGAGTSAGAAENCPAAAAVASSRERIERYKEERRNRLRERFSSEAFRQEPQEPRRQAMGAPPGQDRPPSPPTAGGAGRRQAAPAESAALDRPLRRADSLRTPAAAAAARDPTEDVNVRERVAGWSRAQGTAARPAGAAPPPVCRQRSAPDVGKIRHIAAKFESSAGAGRGVGSVSTV